MTTRDPQTGARFAILSANHSVYLPPHSHETIETPSPYQTPSPTPTPAPTLSLTLDALVATLRAHLVPFEEKDGTVTVMDEVQIAPPYGPDQCHSKNDIMLERVQALLFPNIA
jgi:hypothetical protein